MLLLLLLRLLGCVGMYRTLLLLIRPLFRLFNFVFDGQAAQCKDMRAGRGGADDDRQAAPSILTMAGHMTVGSHDKRVK